MLGFKKKKDSTPEIHSVVIDYSSLNEELIDDVTYIREIKHIRGKWQQYDVLLEARGYGWDYMVDTAAYMEGADLDNVSTVTTAPMGNMPETEHINEYRASQKSLKEFEPLSVEQGQLAIGGISRVLKAPVKIVWFNQTKILRVFSLVDDDVLMTKYIETVIRRTFGTPDEMKLAKLVPTEEKQGEIK